MRWFSWFTYAIPLFTKNISLATYHFSRGLAFCLSEMLATLYAFVSLKSFPCSINFVLSHTPFFSIKFIERCGQKGNFIRCTIRPADRSSRQLITTAASWEGFFWPYIFFLHVEILKMILSVIIRPGEMIASMLKFDHHRFWRFDGQTWQNIPFLL